MLPHIQQAGHLTDEKETVKITSQENSRPEAGRDGMAVSTVASTSEERAVSASKERSASASEEMEGGISGGDGAEEEALTDMKEWKRLKYNG
nr:hypothetical protein Iba_chr04dCG13440 [Ipomoea batatas]